MKNLDYTYQNVSDIFSINSEISKRIEYITDNSSKLRDVVNYFKIINHTREIIDEKLEVISVESKHSIRNRRGIIDGLGSIVKFVTGNLDAYDGQKYEKLLQNIKDNQQNMASQIASQYSVNTIIIEKFNKTINIVGENFSELKQKLLLVNKKLNNYVELEKLRDVLNQLQILYSIMLSLVQEVENSLTFCKLGVLHPSIISTKELFNEIEKISKYYVNQLPLEPTIENILDFENLVKVDCKLSVKEIIYFIKLPIVEKTDFRLYKLFSVPTKFESGYVTIIPEVKYLLKSTLDLGKFRVEGLDNNCNSKILSKFLCSSEQISHHELKCENSIIQSGTTTDCKYTALEINENLIRWVPEIHQYLAILPQKETLKLESQTETAIKTLQGIYLINPNDSKIIFRGRQLQHSSKSRGHPKFLDVTELNFKASQRPEFSIKLQNLNLEKIDLNSISPVYKNTIFSTEISLWTVILYSVLVIIVLYMVYRRLFKRGPPATTSQRPPEVLFRDGGVTE